MGSIEAHDLKVVVLRVDTIHVIHFTIKVNLVDKFRPHLRLPMENNLVSVIILSKVTVIL